MVMFVTAGNMQLLAKCAIRKLLALTAPSAAADAPAASAGGTAGACGTRAVKKPDLSKQAVAAGSSSSQQDQLLPWLVMLARSLMFSGQAYRKLCSSNRRFEDCSTREVLLQLTAELVTGCVESVGLIRRCMKQLGLAGKVKAAARDLTDLLQKCSEMQELRDDALLPYRRSSELGSVGVDSRSMTIATAVDTESHSVGAAAIEQTLQPLQLQQQAQSLQRQEGHAKQQKQQQQQVKREASISRWSKWTRKITLLKKIVVKVILKMKRTAATPGEGTSKHQQQADQEGRKSEDYGDFSCSSSTAGSSRSWRRWVHHSLLQELEGLGTSLQNFGESVCGHLPMPHCCNNPACTNMEKPSEAKLVAGRNTKCTGCNGLARYCSTDCQKSHWDSHKAACRRLKKAAG